MAPTQLRVLLVAGLVCAAAGWLLARSLDAYSSAGLPRLSWITTVLLVTVAVLLLIAARAVGGWVRERRFDRTMNALAVARMLAVAKAGAVFGAIVCGGYAGFGLFGLQLLDSPAGQRRVLLAGATAIAGLGIALASLRLERACRVPPRDGPGDGFEDTDRTPPWQDGAAHRAATRSWRSHRAAATRSRRFVAL